MCASYPPIANGTTSTEHSYVNSANSATSTVHLPDNPALQNTVNHQTKLMSESKVSGLPTYEEAVVYLPSERSGKPPSYSDTLFYSPMQHI